MTEHGWITVAGQVPSKSNGYRVVALNGHGSLARSAALVRYATNFYLQMGAYRDLGVQGLFELYADVYFTSMGHDLDNSLKVLLDCLQKGGGHTQRQPLRQDSGAQVRRQGEPPRRVEDSRAVGGWPRREGAYRRG